MLVVARRACANAQVYTEREADYARLMPVKVAADTGKKLLCPMPGLVKSIAVTEGQEVKAGETLAVVEAMKMENVLRAERDGTVKKLHAKPGDSLAVDAVIMEFAEAAGAAMSLPRGKGTGFTRVGSRQRQVHRIASPETACGPRSSHCEFACRASARATRRARRRKPA